MINSSVFKADISQFHSSIPSPFEGDALSQITALRKSIQKYGLFSPIIVERVGTSLSVVDGRKRLSALIGLISAGVMPRDLVQIPYIVISKQQRFTKTKILDFLPLLSNRQKYQMLLRLIESGQSASQIAETLYAPRSFVTKLASVSRLSRQLKRAFLRNALTLAQAQAFSTLRHHHAQERLLELLGPFVDAPTILSAIEAGETVVDCGDENVIIMPSLGSTDIRRAYAA